MGFTIIQMPLNAEYPEEWLQVNVGKWPLSNLALIQMAKIFELFAEQYRDVIKKREEEEKAQKARLLWARQFTPPSTW